MEPNNKYLLMLEKAAIIGEKERIDYRLVEIEEQFNILLSRPHVRAAMIEIFAVNTISNLCTDMKKHSCKKNRDVSKSFTKMTRNCNKLLKYYDVKKAISIVKEKTILERQNRDLKAKIELFNNEEFNNGKQM